jgi:Cu(I)/Ag(I) efflux system membrane protein CusA/SilA
VLFEDGTDPYWARSRVLEYLNQIQSRLPAQARPALGPDATGVGWIYEYALVDRSGRHDLSQLRALQDWFLKYELKTVPNVSEVARSAAWCASTRSSSTLTSCAPTASRTPGSSMRCRSQPGIRRLRAGMAEAEYMVRASGYLKSLDDFRRSRSNRRRRRTSDAG